MRIASVLHDVSPEPDGAPLFPTVALERDGALYRVSALARAFGPRYAALHDDEGFHHTIVAMGVEPLRELDQRLRSGERPSSARILPGTFTWLPPCDVERAALFVCAPHAEPARAPTPSFTQGAARCLFGHDAAVPIPIADGSTALDVRGSLAVVIGEDLHRATAAEADRAILGYTLLLSWAPGFGAQLGPVLVTRDEAHGLSSARVRFDIGGASIPTGEPCGSAFTLAESIAWISHHVPLCAGDVVDAGRIAGASALDAGATLREGTRVELVVERIGRIAGRGVVAPPFRAWRRAPPADS